MFSGSINSRVTGSCLFVSGRCIPVYQTAGYKLQSDSLKVSVVAAADGKQNVQIDCVWGDF